MHPNAIIPVRIDGKAVDDELVSKSLLFINVYLGVVLLATILLVATGTDILEAFSGTIAAMGNVGPGLGSVGSIGNFDSIPTIGKWILASTMLLGRMEIYALFIFFSPKQWKKRVSY